MHCARDNLYYSTSIFPGKGRPLSAQKNYRWEGSTWSTWGAHAEVHFAIGWRGRAVQGGVDEVEKGRGGPRSGEGWGTRTVRAINVTAFPIPGAAPTAASVPRKKRKVQKTTGAAACCFGLPATLPNYPPNILANFIFIHRFSKSSLYW